jgi:hypothetical protein
MANVWSPRVSARPENGCMQYIPVTHKLGIVNRVVHDAQQRTNRMFC